MTHRYETQLRNELNQISSCAYDGGVAITKLERSAGLEILGVLIRYACKGQNILPITLVSKQIRMIPTDWLVKHFPQVSKSLLNLEDEWEYRRLLELSEKIEVPQLLKWVIEQGKDSPNEEVREASEDFANKLS